MSGPVWVAAVVMLVLAAGCALLGWYIASWVLIAGGSVGAFVSFGDALVEALRPDAPPPSLGENKKGAGER